MISRAFFLEVIQLRLPVILSAVRHERSRRIHDMTASTNMHKNHNAMDSSTSFVPHCAQNDRQAQLYNSYLRRLSNSAPVRRRNG